MTVSIKMHSNVPLNDENEAGQQSDVWNYINFPEEWVQKRPESLPMIFVSL